MRISDINTYLVRANEGRDANRPQGRNWLFVTVHTDEGLVGTGEGGGWPEVVEAGIRQIAPMLVGDDPMAAERIWLKIYDILHGHGLTGAVRGGVQSAIDMALWDIKGQALGVPVYELLGGAVHDRIRVYGHAGTVGRARELVADGYTAFKTPPSAQVFAAIREAVGDDVDMGLHGHGEFTVHAAVRLARDAEPYRPAFFEEPTSPDRLDALKEVAAKVDVPLAAGERLYHKWSSYELITSGAIALFQPETTRLGGITELKKTAGLAEAAGVFVAPHDGSVGPVVEMANIHVMASAPNFLFLEHMWRDVPWRRTVVRGAAEVVDGHIALPSVPGLGINLNIEAIGEHPVPPTEDFRYDFRAVQQIQRWDSDGKLDRVQAGETTARR